MKKDRKQQQDLIFFENALVRFRMISTKNLEALKSDRLYYSTPNNFNDPYDTLIYANHLQIIQDIGQNLEMCMDSYLDKLKDKNIQDAKIIAGFGYAMWNGSKRDKFLENYFRQICDAVTTLKEMLRKYVKVICFSEEQQSMLMWSHYADNHKGFAIIYDKDKIENAENYTNSEKLISKKPILKQVTYVQQQTDLTLEIEDYVRAYKMQNLGDVVPPVPNLSQDKLRRMMTEKALDWSYEKEWRVIPRHISLEHESDLGYMLIKPMAIILGSMCSEENQREIMDICKEKKIPVFKAELNYWEPSYKLALRELSHLFVR